MDLSRRHPDQRCDAQGAGVNVDYTGECGTTDTFSTLYYFYDQTSGNPPTATVVINTGTETVTFEGADLMTRTTFTGGVYLNTIFYGLTNDGSQIEFQLMVSSIGFSIPKTMTLDGTINYARWTRLGNELVGNLYGDVTIAQYTRNGSTITLIEITGDQLTYTPN